MTKPMTGRTVFLIFAGCFGLIIGVNLALAVSAVRTFPGLETDNSYVASQKFQVDRTAQEALGWTVDAALADGLVMLSVSDRGGAVVRPAKVEAILGRATEAKHDIALDFRREGTALVAEAPGTQGRWVLRLHMVAEDGTKFRQIITLNAENGA